MSLAQRISEAFVLLFGGGIQLSNRNGFVDGAFANWQSGAANPATLATAYNYVGPTMWRVGAGTGGAGTIALLDLRNSTDMASMEGEDTINAVKLVITTGSTGTVAARTAGAIFQNIENVARYAGKSVTLSFKLKADAALTIPSLLCSQVFGAGGSPSASVVFDKAVTWAVGTTYKKFSVRVDVPSISGKTLGTTFGTDYLSMGFWLPPGVTTTGLYIAEAQIESCSPNASNDLNGGGGCPTSFEHRGMQAELARTQRYYALMNASFVGSYGAASSNIYADFTFPVAMRAGPAVSLAGAVTYNNASSYIVSGVIGTGAVRMSVLVTATGSAYGYVPAGIILDARI